MSEKVWVRGQTTPIVLSDHDFVAEGGEGKVYAKGRTAYKIHTDRMPADGKIRKLQDLKHSSIISPVDILLNKKNKPVGYTMKKVKGIPFSRLFTNDFRNQSGFTMDDTKALIINMRDGFQYLHDNDVLVVDANENNFLAGERDLTKPFFIDTCSYQVPGFKATAIAENIRDLQATEFSEGTDWFSFAIIACQLFVGIHPFKGKHPDFKKNDLAGRMKAGVSIFNKKTSIPSAARDLSNIPQNYYDWFMDVFENGERHAPPVDMVKGVVAAKKAVVIQGNNNFTIDLVKEYKDTITDYWYYSGNTVVRFEPGHYEVNKINRAFGQNGYTSDVVFTPRTMKPLFVEYFDDKIEYTAFDSTEVHTLPMKTTQGYTTGSTIMAISDTKLNSFACMDFGDKINFAVSKQWDILPHATKAFRGFLYSNMLGKPYVIIYQADKDATHYVNVDELKGYNIINGKYENNVLVVVTEKSGVYDRFIINFDTTFKKYTVVTDNDVDDADVNFTVLENGIVAFIPNDGELRIFSNKYESTQAKVIQDTNVKAVMRLCNNGINVMFYSDNKLYKITMV